MKGNEGCPFSVMLVKNIFDDRSPLPQTHIPVRCLKSNRQDFSKPNTLWFEKKQETVGLTANGQTDPSVYI